MFVNFQDKFTCVYGFIDKLKQGAYMFYLNQTRITHPQGQTETLPVGI